MGASRRYVRWLFLLVLGAGACDDIEPASFDASPFDAAATEDGAVGVDARPAGCTSALSVGGATTCVITESRTIQCWGEGGFGELGDDVMEDRSEAVTVSDVSDAISLGVAGKSTCAIRDSGLYCWGDNAYGQLGDESVAENQGTPFEIVNAGTDFDAVDGGWVFACILTDGAARCWGWNGLGEMGNGGMANDSYPPADVMGVSTATALELGSSTGCVIFGAGDEVACWGENADGQAGGTPGAPRTSATAIAGLTDIAQISIGQYHGCARTASGDVFCWGRDSEDQLGTNGTGADSGAPIQIVLPAPASWIGAGFYHTCAVTSAGLYCWGRNDHGQIGAGTFNASRHETYVAGLDDAVEVEGGTFHTCARTADGNVFCWGNNVHGSVADGTFDDRADPYQVAVDCE